jgi:hypothetical protein
LRQAFESCRDFGKAEAERLRDTNDGDAAQSRTLKAALIAAAP